MQDATIGTDQDYAPESFTTERLCQRMLDRHRNVIRVQKDHLAVKKLVKITNAALNLSNRLGFHAMTLRDLARESGVSMGGLYSYFDSKTTLLMMVLTEVGITVTEVLDQAPTAVRSDPRRHLCWLIDRHIRLTETMQPWFVFSFMEAKVFPQPARRMAVDSEEATEKMFADVLQAGIETGVFRIPSAQLSAALIKPLLQDWYIKRAKYGRRGVTVTAYVEMISFFLLKAFDEPRY